MKAFQHLKELSLVGTSRKQLDKTLLPSFFQDHLKQVDGEDPSNEFLHVLSLAHYYKIAGEIPASYEGSWEMKAIIEDLEEASEDLMILFKKINALESSKKDLLSIWLELLLQKNLIVGSKAIIPLLQIGVNSPAVIKKKISQVIGKKGRYIMQQHHPFQFANENTKTSSKQIWEEGSSKERKALFLQLREEDPTKSIELLHSTWNTESIRDKFSFLQSIKGSLNNGDLDFLEGLYHGEFRYQPKEKKYQLLCRTSIVYSLLALPQSQLHQTTMENLAHYTPTKSGNNIFNKVFKKNAPLLNLPEQEDAFWNADYLFQTYAFDLEELDIAQYQSKEVYFFASFLSAIPLESWNSLFQKDSKHTLEFFLNYPQFLFRRRGKVENQLKIALDRNVYTHANQEMIMHLLKANPQEEAYLARLNPVDWESYIVKEELFNHKFLGSSNLALGAEWSPQFSEKVLKAIVKNFQNRSVGYDYSLGHTLAKNLHTDTLGLLLKLHQEKASNFFNHNMWHKHFYTPIVEHLEIRKLIKSHKLN